jgi:tRNA (guanine-N7-)-methyltransferase
MELPRDFGRAEKPPDWDALFGVTGTLELEIGSGHGGFASAYAAKFPSVRLVAIEKRLKYARETAARVKRRGLSNVAVLCADAQIVVPKLFAPGSLAAVHVHFPDPWWKRRHIRRRLVTERFAIVLHEKLVPGGLLDVRTDVDERALELARIFESEGFENQHGEFAFGPTDPNEVPSSREVRYLASGQRVFRLRLRKP